MNELKIIKGPLPDSISLKEFSRVATEFYKDAKLSIDYSGFLSRTMELFASATFLNEKIWDIFVNEVNGEIKAYFLCAVEKAIDGNLCYTVHQGWITQELRSSGCHKEWWKQVKERARKLFCNQMLISSVRNYEAYKRWLGEENLSLHSELLHLKLEE